MKNALPGCRRADRTAAEPRLCIKAAVPGDARAIVRLIRQGFRRSDLGLFIYGCRGITTYVAEEILGARGARNPYSVASLAGSVVGCVDLRQRPEGLFLNYIAVAPKARSRGIAVELLRWVLASPERQSASRFTLDVLDDNTVALDWYLRLGFSDEGHHLWCERDGNSVGRVDARAAELDGWPQAEASQRRYGFSRFGVVTRAGRYDVGRLGDRWFRILSPETLEDGDAMGCLNNLDPRRRFLCILRDPVESQLRRLGLRTIRRTRRLSIETASLIANLGSGSAA